MFVRKDRENRKKWTKLRELKNRQPINGERLTVGQKVRRLRVLRNKTRWETERKKLDKPRFEPWYGGTTFGTSITWKSNPAGIKFEMHAQEKWQETEIKVWKTKVRALIWGGGHGSAMEGYYPHELVMGYEVCQMKGTLIRVLELTLEKWYQFSLLRIRDHFAFDP